MDMSKNIWCEISCGVGVQASSAVSSGTARRTSGRLASKSSAGGSQAPGPARSTRSKSHSTASGLAAVSK